MVHQSTMTETEYNLLITQAARQGASVLFCECLRVCGPEHFMAHKTRQAQDRGGLPGPWGHFMTAAWQGDESGALARADGRNKPIVRQAIENIESR